MTLSDPELATDFQASLAKAINPGSVVTQPMQSFRLQLKVVIRFLRGLLINHDTPPLLPASGRIQFAPVYLSQIGNTAERNFRTTTNVLSPTLFVRQYSI